MDRFDNREPAAFRDGWHRSAAVDPDAVAVLGVAIARRHADVDRLALIERCHAPHRQAGDVADGRAIPDCEQSREELTLERQLRASDREDPSILRVQRATVDAMTDRAVAKAELSKLLISDRTPLLVNEVPELST
jgi:hypothetical protein